MGILDFRNWSQILESVDLESSTKIFTIGPDFKKKVYDTYYQVADSLLKESATFFEYSLDQDSETGQIVITFGEEEDEIRSSIFGTPESFKITLDSLVYSSGYGMAKLNSLSPQNLIKMITVQYRKYSRKPIVETDGDTQTVRVRLSNKDFEKSTREICANVATPRNEYGLPTGDLINTGEPSKPTSEDYNRAFRQSESDKSGKDIKSLSNKLNAVIKYRTTWLILNEIVSDLAVDEKELTTQISEKMDGYKSIDLSKLSDEERAAKINEILKFQKYLLTLSHPAKVEESKLTTDSLVDGFRILLKQFGDIKSVKKELDGIK